jgi:hypothetical protein
LSQLRVALQKAIHQGRGPILAMPLGHRAA